MTQHFFTENLINWYQANKRDLPWRHTTDPYPIWLSEIILQQTRVAQGLPYYHKFLETFPSIHHFSAASETEILRLWQGLGYYSRARNMHFTAQYISNELNGQFPNNYKDLLKLKGLGQYTAAAVASFAFNEKIAVVDGNVYRVLSRFFGIYADIASPKGKSEFYQLANEIIPNINSSIYNQAIMEFGATQCTPKGPNCEICPLQAQCYAFKAQAQAILPVNNKVIKQTERFFYYLVIEHESNIYLAKRQNSGIWEGLFEFYLIEKQFLMEVPEVLDELNHPEILQNAKIITISDNYVQLLTHQKLNITFIHIHIPNSTNFIQENIENFHTLAQIEALPKPITIANYFKKYLKKTLESNKNANENKFKSK